jgi:hypothetical protein
MPFNIVSDDELNKNLLKYKEIGSQVGQNAYGAFIKEKKQTEHFLKDENGKPFPGVESHHIIPRHEGGSDETENLVLLLIKDHVIAHWLRWKELDSKKDKLAYLFRVSDTEERAELRRQSVMAARAEDQKQGKGFFNSELQRQSGLRGGSRGGSANTTAQFVPRSALGQKQGPITGRANQKPEMVEFLKKNSIWAYSYTAAKARENQGYNQDNGIELLVVVSPKTAFIELVKVLNAVVPDSVINPTSLHKLVYGERKQLYGWRIVNTLTRSEALVGLQELETQNPGTNIIYDEDV